MRRSVTIRTALYLFASFAVGCSGGSSSSSTPTVVGTPAGPSVPGAAAAVADDWVTFAHDFQRTGTQLQHTGISKTNVASLALSWSTTIPDEIYSSPLVSGGLVIVAGQNTGTVFALSSATGKVVWKTQVGAQIHSTGTIADGSLFFGTHNFALDSDGDYIAAVSTFYSLDVTTGAVRWSIPVAGNVRGTPVVSGGRVYYDVAGGDLPTCFQGGVHAVDETSGAPIWSWNVESQPGLGGAMWAPLTFDGSHIFAGTGNTCGPAISTANGFVAIDASSGTLAWSLVAQPNSVSDDDTGGGAVLLNGTLYYISKDGSFYAVDQKTGALDATVRLNPYDFQGGWATATTDGSTILVGDGVLAPSNASSQDRARSKSFYSARRQNQAASAGTSELVALDTGLNVKWRVPVQNAISSYAAIDNGVVFATLDASIAAIDETTGAKLWTHPTAQLVNGGPAVVPSGVYVADSEGTVYKFALPATVAASAVRR